MKFAPHPVFGLFISVSVAACAPVGWEHKTRLPNQFQSGLEIARNEFGDRRASLSLVCDTAGSTRLFLHTRLPIPEWIRQESRHDRAEGHVGRGESVTIFVGGIERKIVIPFYISGGEPLDEILTDPLLPDDLANLTTWYSPWAPAKVSVVGIDETGVYIRGKRSGASITKFWSACRPMAGQRT